MTRWARASARRSESRLVLDKVSMQTNISNGIKQATSKAGATMLGTGCTPTGMGCLPWLTLVRDQAGACKLLGNILVNCLDGI